MQRAIGETDSLDGFSKPFDTPLARFDQMKAVFRTRYRERETGKSGTGAEIPDGSLPAVVAEPDGTFLVIY